MLNLICNAILHIRFYEWEKINENIKNNWVECVTWIKSQRYGRRYAKT